MKQLQQILLKPIEDNDRTRRYQEVIDLYVDQMKESWDLDRGLCGSEGLDLPHETVEGYWGLPEEEREKITSNDAQKLYQQSAGRGGTHRLGVAGFAWHSPLSRHHQAPELLQFYENGLRFFASTIRDDGVFALYGLNGLDWAHGWDIEGVIYGLVFLWDAVDPDLRDWALSRLRLSAQRFVERGPSGTHGNQGSVQALGLFLYGHLLEMPEAVQASDERWAALVTKVLDDDGQVVEQYGPCMHYSYTCFIYAWLNAYVRGGDGEEARIEKCLSWFRYRHTESLYPFPGPSSRSYYEEMGVHAADLLAACEHVAPRNPVFQSFADNIWERIEGAGGGGHGASPLMWAILACPGALDASPEQQTGWTQPFEAYYERINLLGRSPLKYLLIRRRYQTEFNVCDFLPFSGIQTWAWGDEPPIIHPTKLTPSTTQAWGLDTARQGVSHNWGLFGAGAMEADIKQVLADEPGEPSYILTRYDLLWRLIVFTEVSTVILEWGRQGPRKTLWTLNRREPTATHIAEGVVTFAERTGRLYSTISQPTSRELGPGDWTEGVRILEYDCGEGFCAFALSNETFRFDGGDFHNAGTCLFADESGSYRVYAPSGFITEENPGNCTLSRGHLFWEVKVDRTE